MSPEDTAARLLRDLSVRTPERAVEVAMFDAHSGGGVAGGAVNYYAATLTRAAHEWAQVRIGRQPIEHVPAYTVFWRCDADCGTVGVGDAVEVATTDAKYGTCWSRARVLSCGHDEVVVCAFVQYPALRPISVPRRTHVRAVPTHRRALDGSVVVAAAR